MEKLYKASFRRQGKVTRKGYASEKSLLRAAWKWLLKHQDETGKSVSLYGPDMSPATLDNHHDEVLEVIEQEQRRKTEKEDASAFYQSQAWLKLRYQVFERDGNRCSCCGISAADGAVLHVDHIKPRSTHPQLALELNNLQILCDACNLGKSNDYETQWR